MSYISQHNSPFVSFLPTQLNALIQILDSRGLFLPFTLPITHLFLPTILHCNPSNRYFLARRNILRHRRTCEVFPSAYEIPRYADQSETSKYHARIVHRRRFHRQADWHTEQHDGKNNPANHSDVDGISETTERERGVLHSLATADDGDENGHAVGG
jgi:hypothetical protein